MPDASAERLGRHVVVSVLDPAEEFVIVDTAIRQGFDVRRLHAPERCTSCVHDPRVALWVLDGALDGGRGVALCADACECRLHPPILALVDSRQLLRDAAKLRSLRAGILVRVWEPAEAMYLVALMTAPAPPEPAARAICWRDLSVCPATRRVIFREASAELSRGEYLLLEMLIVARGSVVSCGDIAQRALGRRGGVGSGPRDLKSALARKLAGLGCTDAIENVYGKGYRLQGRIAPHAKGK